jgi:hypothetical protein
MTQQSISDINLKSANFFIKNRINFIVLISLINYFCIHCFVLPGDFACAAFYDEGWLSVFTMLMITANSALIMWLLCGAKSKKEVMTFALLLYVNQIYAFREAEFHRFFTTGYEVHSVTKFGFYTNSAIPVLARIIPAVILIVFAVCAFVLLFAYGWKIIKAFFSGDPAAIAFFLWGFLLLFSQILDRSKAINHSPSWRIRSIEEMMEVSSSVFGLLAMILYLPRYINRSSKNTNSNIN